MKRYGVSYRKRLLLYLFAGGVLPILLASAMILYSAELFYEATQAESAQAEAQRISMEADHLLSAYRRLMNPLLMREETAAFLRGDRTEIERLYGDLYAILAGHMGEVSLYLISADGSGVIATDILPCDYALPKNLHWGLLGRAAQGSDWVVLAADKSAPDRAESVFSTACPIRRGEELLGFAVVDVKREALMPILRQAQGGGAGRIFLTDRYDYVMLDLFDRRKEGIPLSAPGASEGAEHSFRAYVHRSPESGFAVHILRPRGFAPFSYLLRIILAVDAAALCITAYLAYLLSRSLWRPLHALTLAMRRVRRNDDFTVQVDIRRTDEIGELALTFNRLIRHVQILLAENRERQRRLRIAEVKSLTEMIRPHFIYNTLNLIKWSAKLGDSEGAAEIAVQLGKLLRATLSGKEFVTVAEEIDFLRNYLGIQQKRFEGRLEFFVRLDPAIEGCFVPRLILQPLVENAIRHGIEEMEGAGRIELHGGEEGGYLVFCVKDNGRGIPETRQQEILARRDENHFGLYNVHTRAVLNGDAHCGIRLRSEPGGGTEVVLTLTRREEDCDDSGSGH